MPVRGIGVDEVLPYGGLISRLCNYALASYTAAGTSAPADGDVVAFSSGANSLVVIAADNDIGATGIGRVKGAPNTTDLTVNVEFFNVYAFVELTCDDMSTVTLANSCKKDGNTTVVNNFDAATDTTGNLVAISKSATSGAGTICAAVVITGK
jgi:hypothetical protein